MGLSKLWGKDSTGARGFVFSHVKTIYYNWKDKKLLSTKLDEIDNSINSLNSSMSKIIGITGDLNDIREFSYGYATTNAINKPVSRNGYVETLPSSGESASIILQRYTPYMQNSIYIRWCESGAWSEWTLVDNS